MDSGDQAVNDNGMHNEKFYKMLCDAVKHLKREIVELLLERDELVLHTCKAVEADYMMKIGVLEYQAYELQCKILRIKRKTALIRSRINRKEVIFIPQIEQILDREYAQYSQQLKSQMEAVAQALQWSESPLLSAKDTSELKHLYKKLVKQLHPDLNPGAEEEKDLFLHVVDAFERGDLNTLRALAVLMEDVCSEEENEGGIEALEARKIQLLEEKESILQQIKLVKTSFPYNQREFLRSRKNVAHRQEELKQLIEDYRVTYQEFENALKQMLGG